MPIPTPRFAIAAAVIAVALMAYPGRELGSTWLLLIVVNAVLVLAAVIDSLLAVKHSSIAVERHHRPTVEKGGRTELVWRISNRSRRAIRVHVADTLAPSLRAGEDRFTTTIAGSSTAVATTELAPVRRGKFPMPDLTVRIEGPLGLASRQRRMPCPTTLRVLPFFRSRKDAEIKINAARIMEIGLRSARGFGAGTEFETLREYGNDDDFRRIDWRASARAGKAIVRTFRAERNQNVVILLDNGRVMAGQVDGFPRVEHTMDAAMMLCTVATRLGDKCGLVTFDTEVRSIVAASRNKNHIARHIDAMFHLEPVLAESDYVSAFGQTIARFRRRALLVVLTDLVEQAVAESLLPALPLILRTHLVVIGAVSDPVISEWASAHPTTEDEAYRTAASINALAERQRTAARLRAAGATVIDAPSTVLPGKLADEYLAMKASGRL